MFEPGLRDIEDLAGPYWQTFCSASGRITKGPLKGQTRQDVVMKAIRALPCRYFDFGDLELALHLSDLDRPSIEDITTLAKIARYVRRAQQADL